MGIFKDKDFIYTTLDSGARVKVGIENDLSSKRVDMHIHSTASDGSLTPEELVELVKMSNIGTMAITDHDNLLGTRRLLGMDTGLEIYSGIELSVLVREGKSRIHILGYDFDVNNPDINKIVDYVDKCSEYNFRLYISCLKRKFPEIEIPEEEIDNIFMIRKLTGKNIGRVDIAQLLIKYGYADLHADEFPAGTTKQEIVFQKYLNPVKYEVAHEKKGITEEDAITAIKKAGGLVSLAHPSSLKLGDEALDERIRLYKEMGMDGLEVYHPNNSEEQRRYYEYLANKYNMLISGGTDYHGLAAKPDIILGHGRNGNIDLRQDDLTLVKALRKRH